MRWEFSPPQRSHTAVPRLRTNVPGCGWCRCGLWFPELHLRPAEGGPGGCSESSMLLPMAPSSFDLLLWARGAGVGDRVRMRLEEPTGPGEGGSTLQAREGPGRNRESGQIRQGGSQGPSPNALPLPSLGTTL